MKLLYQLLDIPKGLDWLAKQLRGMEFGSSLFLFIVLGLLTFPLVYFYWTYDLISTWNWTEYIGLRDSDTEPMRASVATALDVATPGAVMSLLIWIVAMMPTLSELGLPKLVGRHTAALGVFLKTCIGFDYFTDFPAIWNIVHTGALNPDGVTRAPGWFDSWGWGVGVYIPQALAAIVLTFIVSVVLQVVIILIGAALLYLLFGILVAGYRGSLDDVSVQTGDRQISVKRLHE
jgi:hypothetical protein